MITKKRKISQIPEIYSLQQTSKLLVVDNGQSAIISAGNIVAGISAISITHINDTNNPHNVTKAQVGLGNVDNTSDLNKPISNLVTAALATKQNLLVSGANIKTINGQSLLGSGDLILANAVTSVNDFTGAVSLTTDNIPEGGRKYFSTDLVAAYGDTVYAKLGTIYNNPTFINTLAWSKLTGIPNTLLGYGITDPVVFSNTVYGNPAFIGTLAWSKLIGTPTTLSGYGITDAVPSSRTLTINGTTYDLSANRSWTISTATPTLDAVTTAGATTTNAITVGGLTVATNLIYTDLVNNRVGIGTTSPIVTFDVNGNMRTNASMFSEQNLTKSIRINSVTFMRFYASNGTTDVARYYDSGNWVFQTGETFTDAGYKVDINGSTRLNGLQTFQGTTASDAPTLGSELATTGSGTNWTGTSFATGYTHTPGASASLTTTLNAIVGTYYQISVTITGRTTGTISVGFGGYNPSSFFGSESAGIRAISTAVLTVSPSTDFDGTVILSVKTITASSAITTWNSSTATVLSEMRYDGNTSLSWGVDAGKYLTTGTDNISIGYQAGFSLVGANYNIAIGTQALSSAVNSLQNVAIGYLALRSNNNNTGQNTAVGYTALSSSSNSGSRNTAFGALAGNSISTGSNNTLIGCASSLSLSTGSNNTFVGATITVSATTSNTVLIGSSLAATGATNSIGIGYNVNAAGSSNLVLGYNGTTTATSNTDNSVIGYNASVTGASNTSNTIFGHSATSAYSACVILGRGAASTASNQFVVGSATYNAGTITTAVAPVINEYWTVVINGVTKKIALIA